MLLPKATLVVTGAVFVAAGMVFLANPDRLASAIGLATQAGRSHTEIRAMYGGLQLGLGIFFLVSSVRIRWIRAALAAQSLILGFSAAGRSFGILLTGRDRLMMGLTILDIAGAILGFVAFSRAKVALQTLHDRRTID